MPLAPELLKTYAGLYWNDAESAARRFEFDDGKLFAIVGRERQALKSLGGGRFVLTTGAPTRLLFEADGGAPRVTVTNPGGTDDRFVRTEPFSPAPAKLAEFAGTYRSDEIEPVYRMVVHGGVLRLERLKSRPANLQPVVTDTFTTQIGTLRFVRDGSTVTGFVLEAGRVRRVKFKRDDGK